MEGNLGDFLLYKNTEYQSEIHARHHSCSADIYGSCACAVAIQGGGDVFFVDVCGAQKYADFSHCHTNVLSAHETSPGRYEVTKRPNMFFFYFEKLLKLLFLKFRKNDKNQRR